MVGAWSQAPATPRLPSSSAVPWPPAGAGAEPCCPAPGPGRGCVCIWAPSSSSPVHVGQGPGPSPITATLVLAAHLDELSRLPPRTWDWLCRLQGQSGLLVRGPKAKQQQVAPPPPGYPQERWGQGAGQLPAPLPTGAQAAGSPWHSRSLPSQPGRGMASLLPDLHLEQVGSLLRLDLLHLFDQVAPDVLEVSHCQAKRHP